MKPEGCLNIFLLAITVGMYTYITTCLMPRHHSETKEHALL